MIFSLIPWVISGLLLYTCMSLALSSWKRKGRLSRRRGMSLLVGMLEIAAVAGLFRLLMQWSPGTVVLWVAAAVALAVAVAGVIIRWPELSARPSRAERVAADSAAAEPFGAGEPADSGEPAGSGEGAPEPGSETIGTKTTLKTMPTTMQKQSLKKKSKKPKKEPGKAAVAGHAGFLAVVVAVSFAIG